FTEGTWDAVDQEIVTYGGDNFHGALLRTTLAYSAGNWSMVSTSGVNPGALDGPALAFDPADGVVVMFGGLSSYTPVSYTNLTYTYAGGVWSSATLSPSPPSRTAGAMVYDDALGGLVLFGGYNNSDPTGSTMLNDLWLYKTGVWSKLPDANPPPVRTWAPLSYDPGLGKLVLYGGLTPASTCLNDTWTYNGTWTQVTVPLNGPNRLVATELTYDPQLGHVVLTGGATCPGAVSTQMWAFNGTAWNPVSVGGTPSDHYYGIAAWDPTLQMLVVSGGKNGGTYTDVLSQPLTVAAVTAPGTGEAGQGLSFLANVTGGVPSRTYAWNWGDGSPTSYGASASHAFALAGPYGISLNVTDGAGGSASWNGSVSVSVGLSTEIVGSPTVLDAGINGTFSAAFSGGSGTPTFVWNFGDGGRAGGQTVSHAFASSGNYTVSVRAADSVGGISLKSLLVRVYPALLATVPSPAVADVGTPAHIAALVTGGDPPVTVHWQADDGASGSGTDLAHTFATAGTHSVAWTVTDATNGSVTRQADVVVSDALGVTISGPTQLSVSASGVWSAQLTGGTSPASFTWTGAGGSLGNGTSATTGFSSPGTYQVSVRVTDPAGASKNATIEVSVASSSSPFGTTVDGVPVLGVVALVVVLGVAAAGVAIWRRGRARSPPTRP
ncbi:MAG TPA: PKD domain-containing protein, partial [Thermoplasmata archaeon]|nr:PKD domain-containing protein [Thermoplasmata archaeon]